MGRERPRANARHGTTRAPLSRRRTERMENPIERRRAESGRVGYLVLYMLGVPVGLLILLWVLLGNNIFGPG